MLQCLMLLLVSVNLVGYHIKVKKSKKHFKKENKRKQKRKKPMDIFFHSVLTPDGATIKLEQKKTFLTVKIYEAKRCLYRKRMRENNMKHRKTTYIYLFFTMWGLPQCFSMSTSPAAVGGAKGPGYEGGGPQMQNSCSDIKVVAGLAGDSRRS